MRKLNIGFLITILVSVAVYATGGNKRYSEDSISFGTGTTDRTLFFDYDNDPAGAKITVDPLAPEFIFNRKIIGNDLELSGKLSMTSTSEGANPCPSMTEIQKLAIATPVASDCVYDTTKNAYSVYDGSNWKSVGGGGSASTGTFSGGNLSIGTPTSTYTISDGSGQLVDDYTDPTNVVTNDISWTGLTNLTITNLATAPATYVGIQAGPVVVQQTTPFTTEQYRDTILIGILIHTGNTVVESVSADPHYLGQPLNQIADLASAIGIINVEGNVYSANGANLNINKSAGKMFGIGFNFHTSAKNPNVLNTISFDSTVNTFIRAYQDGSGGGTIVSGNNLIDPLLYDDGSGTLASIPNNKWQVKRLYFDPGTNNILSVYGQNVYDTLADAEASIVGSVFSLIPEISDVPLRGWLLVKKEATALNNIVEAKFIEANKFGTAGAGGATSSTTTLQKAYENSPSPEIILDSTRGVMQIADSIAGIVGNLFEVSNNDGSVKNLEVSAERVSITDNDGTHLSRKESDLRFIDQFKSNAPSDLYTEAGVTNAVTNEVSVPLDGWRSAKFTVTTGDALGTITSNAKTGLKPVDYDLMGISLNWKYDGASNDVTLKIEESSDGVSYTHNSKIDLPTGSASRVQLNFQLLSTSTHYRYLFYINTAANGAVFEWDNVKVFTNPLPTVESTVSESGYWYRSTAMGSTKIYSPQFTTEGYNTLSNLGTVDNTDGFSFTATSRCNVIMSYSGSRGSVGATRIGIIKNGNGAIKLTTEAAGKIVAVGFSGGTQQDATATFNGTLEVGDELRVSHDDATVGAASDFDNILTIKATVASTNVVFEGATSDLDTREYIPTLTGFGTPTNINFTYRRVGDSIVINGKFTSGVPTAVEAQITIPSGLSVKAGEPIRINGFGTRNNSTVAAKLFPILSTGGDSFLNMSTAHYDIGLDPLSPDTGNQITASGDDFSFFATIPIEGWKASDILISVPVTNERLNSISLSGNDGRAITATSEDIQFSGTGLGWNSVGDVHTYEVQKNGSTVSISGSIFAGAGSRAVHSSVGGVSKRISAYYNEATHKFSDEMINLSAGDLISFRIEGTGATLVNDSIHHYLSIVERYAPKGYFLGNLSQPKTSISNAVPSGTSSPALTEGFWTDYAITEQNGDDIGMSISSNQITLSSGKYHFSGMVQDTVDSAATGSGQFKARVRNETDGTTLLVGTTSSVYVEGGSTATPAISFIEGTFSISGTKTVSIEYFAQDGSGSHIHRYYYSPISSGEDESSMAISITKLNN